MINPEYKDDNSASGDVDQVRPEVLSEEEFLRRWRQAQVSQRNPLERVEETHRRLPVGSRSGFVLREKTN